MQCIVYVRQRDEISLYEQFNKCADYAKRYGYSIAGKVLDFEGKKFHEAVNKIIANDEISTLIIYSKETAFNNYEESVFYRVYFEKLNKILISVN